MGILDLIQVFVETLDKCFENVCELDLIFHVDKVHFILNELVMGGMVLETNMNEILTRIEDQNKLEKQEVSNGDLLLPLSELDFVGFFPLLFATSATLSHWYSCSFWTHFFHFIDME